jgi:hypothetical protein
MMSQRPDESVRCITFNPKDPPEAIWELDGIAGEAIARLGRLRIALSSSPIDAEHAIAIAADVEFIITGLQAEAIALRELLPPAEAER